jgi:curli biogenesis system outer membrane secretion channel CsgG
MGPPAACKNQRMQERFKPEGAVGSWNAGPGFHKLPIFPGVLKMKKNLATTFLMFALAPAGWAQNKKRVAVIDFDYATVKSSVAAVFGSDTDVGKGIADLMVTRLVNDGVYSVIERKALGKIISEQNFSNSDRANPDTAAKIGRILGVDAIIMGSITQFGRDDKSLGLGGIGASRIPFGLGGAGKKEAKAVVGISARMVSTDTAEILAVAEGKGESKRSGLMLAGAGGSSGGAGGGAVDMSSSAFSNTILGEAVGQAVTEVTKQLDDKAASLPTRVVQVSGLVADVSGNTLILNVGSKAGVKVGDHLGVFRQGRQIKDPATGKVLKTIESKLGDVTVTEVDDSSSTGSYAGETPKVGDAVRNSE